MSLEGEGGIAAVTVAGYRPWGTSPVGAIPRPDGVIAFMWSGRARQRAGARTGFIPFGSA
jgi:hypothetical protein